MIRFRNSLAMLVALFTLAFAFGFASPSEASARCTIWGYVKDAGYPIAAVQIYTFDPYTNATAVVDVTDANGMYSFSLPSNTSTIVYIPAGSLHRYSSTNDVNGSNTAYVGCGEWSGLVRQDWWAFPL